MDSYLSLPEGKPSLNLLKTARDGLLMPLRSAIQRAVKEGNPVRSEAIIFKSGKKRREVTIEIVPIKGRAASEGALLVLFEQDSPAAGPVEPPPRDDFPQESLEAQIGRLEQELASTRDYLQSVIEQGEATNEELQSANEEAQSSNEELQSINEELETSKEEIQSSNEELITVNDELQSRNAEVSQVNNDLVNLIGSVEAAIVMVGLNFCIRRFTPMAERLLNIIPSDVGRPITNISMNVVVPDLRALLTTTIETVNSQELEVQDTNGRWYSLRVRPYVTIEKRIEGAVMILVDIDANKRARDYAESIVETVRQPIVILDEALRIRTANDAFSKLFEVARGDLPGLSLFELGGKPWNAQVLRRLLDSVLPENTTFDDFELSHDFERAGRRTMLFSGRKLTPPGGAAPLVLLAIEDVTERRVNEAAMARDEKAYRVGLESLVSERTHDLNLTVKELEGFCYTVAHDLRTPLRGIIFNSSALIEELGSSVNPDQNRMLRSQVEHAKRLSTLIDDLLEFSRMLNLPVRRQEIDATALVRAVAQELPQAGELVAPELQIQEGMRCEADEPLLRLVFTNLIENAYKFSPRGGNLTVGREMQGEMPVFFVKDEGIGFDMVYSTKVFEPFERLDASEKFAGTGIGLATTKRIVERHGGKIWVTAELGKGAAFYFTLASDIATEPTSRSNETDA